MFLLIAKQLQKFQKKYGAEVLTTRPKKLATDKVSKFLVWKHSIELIEKILKKKIRFIVDLDCTNPLRNKSDILGTINLLKKNKKADASVTICKSKKNPYFNMVEKIKNKFLIISKKNKFNFTSRQSAPNVYDIVANIYCLRPEYLKRSKNFLEGKIIGYELEQNKSFDIDSKYDFEIVKMFLQKNQNL
jgi:CMP-N,N'-diacetyllegionaminic acid synthase